MSAYNQEIVGTRKQRADGLGEAPRVNSRPGFTRSRSLYPAGFQNQLEEPSDSVAEYHPHNLSVPQHALYPPSMPVASHSLRTQSDSGFWNQQQIVVQQTNNERQEESSGFSILEALEHLEDQADEDDEQEDTLTDLKTSARGIQEGNYDATNQCLGNAKCATSTSIASSMKGEKISTAQHESRAVHDKTSTCKVGGDQTVDEDLLLAMALQAEEDEYAAALRRDRDRREEERRQLVMQLLEGAPGAQSPAAPQADETQVIEYIAPESMKIDNHSDFTLVNDSSWATEKDICAICFDSLNTGLVVSLRNCHHLFHMDCIDDALEHSKRCPKCRRDVRTQLSGTAPSGTMRITRPVINRVTSTSGYTEKRVIQIEYIIPDGEQKEYHDFPGDPYKGTIKIAYLPVNSQGTYLLKRLKFAFSHGLTFRVAQANGSEKCVVGWASIPHRFSIGEKEFDGTYMATCNEALDQLGVPTSFEK